MGARWVPCITRGAAQRRREWAQTIKPEEIDALVAPIALYPDSLLSQIFMASTYPLEVVEASRWAKQNQNLKGDALAQALEKQDWDPSVQVARKLPRRAVQNEREARLDPEIGRRISFTAERGHGCCSEASRQGGSSR